MNTEALNGSEKNVGEESEFLRANPNLRYICNRE